MGPFVARLLPLRVVPLPLATFQHLSDPDSDIIFSSYGLHSFYLQKAKSTPTFWGLLVAAPHIVDPQHLAQHKVCLKLSDLSPSLTISTRCKERELKS